MSNLNFFKSLYESNKQDNNNIIFDNDYLENPPAYNQEVIQKPIKTSDFQTNSIIFISNLINKLPRKRLFYINEVKIHIQTFIFLINELIQNSKEKNYDTQFVFLFFLYFLYFMNFRLGQIFLYYVFFEIRKMSNSLSNIFQELIEYSMTYSVVDLNNISTNKDFQNVILPNTRNIKISYNEFTFPDYSVMKEFIPTLKNNNKIFKNKNNNITQKNPVFDTFKQIREDNEVKKTKQKFDEVTNELDKAKQNYDDSNINLKKLSEEAKDAINNTTILKNTLQQTINSATNNNQLNNALITGMKANKQCENIAKDLLSTFIKTKNLENDLINTRKNLETVKNAYINLDKMSKIAKKIIINSKYDTNQTYNNEYINDSDIEKYIPTTNKIDVNAVIKTMNELSIIIAKKYNEQALKNEQTLYGGKKSIKANKLKHICKRHSMRKYKHKYFHHT